MPIFFKERIIKIQIDPSFDAFDFEKLGFRVSHQSGGVAILHCSDEILRKYGRDLETFCNKKKVKYKDFIIAIQELELWKPQDRIGPSISDYEKFISEENNFRLDLALWVFEIQSEKDIRNKVEIFRNYCKNNGIEVLDTFNPGYICLVRVDCKNIKNKKLLTEHNDIYQINLPPSYNLESSLLQKDIGEFPEPPPPPQNSPVIAVLDSGLNASHPLLKIAVADTKNYISNESSGSDDHGHGTAVSSIVLYGNIEKCVREKKFNPKFWIASGKVLDSNKEFNPILIESMIDKAVRELHKEYGCKIFNLSLGDANRVYRDGHPGNFTLLLDKLSYELGVLFIVSIGNSEVQETSYPDYLLDSKLIEPSNAIHAITVGSIADKDLSRYGKRYQNDLTNPIAPINSISPFSRTGPGIRKSIKPELVATGGNLGINKTQSIEKHELGVLGFHKNFNEGKIFSENLGTSFFFSICI